MGAKLKRRYSHINALNSNQRTQLTSQSCTSRPDANRQREGSLIKAQETRENTHDRRMEMCFLHTNAARFCVSCTCPEVVSFDRITFGVGNLRGQLLPLSHFQVQAALFYSAALTSGCSTG